MATDENASPAAHSGFEPDDGQFATTTSNLENTLPLARLRLAVDPIFDGDDVHEGVSARRPQSLTEHAKRNNNC